MNAPTSPKSSSRSSAEDQLQPAAGASAPSTIVIDVDKEYSKKQIKKLRRGEGKLMAKIEELLQDMVERSVIAGTTQPVVIIVREKRDDARSLFG
jgi:hypothetical protein